MAAVTASKKVKLGDEVPAKATANEAEDLEFSKDIKGIISAIAKFKDKATTDVKNKNETIISRLSGELKDLLDDAKTKGDKEWQISIKAISKICKDIEASMKHEANKFQAVHEKFTADLKAHMQTCEDIYNKYEEQKEKLLVKLDQQKKRDKATLEDLHKVTSQKISEAESSLKKRKQEEKSIDYLRKTLGSFLRDNSSDEEPEE